MAEGSLLAEGLSISQACSARWIVRRPNGIARNINDRKNRLLFPKQSAFQFDREMTTVCGPWYLFYLRTA